MTARSLADSTVWVLDPQAGTKAAVEALGARYISYFSPHDPPHFCVGSTVRSTNYKVRGRVRGSGAACRAGPLQPALARRWRSPSSGQATSPRCRWSSPPGWGPARLLGARCVEGPLQRSLAPHALGTELQPPAAAHPTDCAGPVAAPCRPLVAHAPGSARGNVGCLRQGRVQVPPEEHALQPFTGLTICLSGGAPEVKAAAITLVRRYGAAQSPDLNKTCTHLVLCSGAPRSVSPKERCAPQRG